MPLNPYVIANVSPETDEGRKTALTWAYATQGAVIEDKDNAGYASALLLQHLRETKMHKKNLNVLRS